MALLEKLCKVEGVDCIVADNWDRGAGAAISLARLSRPSRRSPRTSSRFIRRNASRRKSSHHSKGAIRRRRHFLRLQHQVAFRGIGEGGLCHLPVCIAKTQYSFSTDANAKGAPSGFTIPIRELRLSRARSSSSWSAATS